MKLLKKISVLGVPIIVLAAMIGGLGGLGTFTFVYGKGYSYMLDDPKACMNCHIMTEQYQGWVKSSHGNVTTCNSCHTPHNNIVNKYLVKAVNGYNHSFAFTTGKFPDPIRINDWNFRITQKACLECHGKLWDSPRSSKTSHVESKGRQCMQCHRNVGHQ